jgi:hypothetical protein
MMRLALNRRVLFHREGPGAVSDDVDRGTVGEPLDFHKDEGGRIVAFDMIFYGYPRIFHKVRTQDLEVV